MYDPELLVKLLRKMSDADNGSGRLNKQNLTPREVHHLELLDDAGQAVWLDHRLIRITKDGYDFLNAIDKDKNAWKNFLELYEKGMPYVTAVHKVIEVLGTVS